MTDKCPLCGGYVHATTREFYEDDDEAPQHYIHQECQSCGWKDDIYPDEWEEPEAVAYPPGDLIW